ncbi:MAG: isoprenylcysteine carboxylmethyltransferase family protein [Candidatus Atribacteria bacterium]|nr:isoprenylcysteine carboxylmethyltransferase family protein [Candidatus Atribacteria bacterium]
MKEEMLFRIVFWVFMFFIMVFNRIIPALRAKKSEEKILPDKKAIKNEGKTTFFLRILLFVLLLAFLILYSIYPPFMNLIHVDFPIWLRWLGTLFAFIGVVLWIYSQAVLGKYWSPQLQVQNEHKIITSGPYRVIRHPIYTSMFIWVIGLALFTANMVFALLALLTIIGLILRVPKEEKMMIEQFGDEYKKYMQITGRFFPRFR